MAICEITVIPLGTGKTSVSKYVAKCLDVARKSGLKYELTPMSTVVEGNLEKILEVIRKMHEVPFNEGAQRVVTTITIDDRRDKKITMGYKIKSVQEKMER